MSASGILRENQVIFYHPLDNNLIEHTTDEVWTGTISSVPGKIGEGESAITSTNIDVTLPTTIRSSTTSREFEFLGAIALSESGVVAMYGGAIHSGLIRAGSVSGSTVTWGDEVLYRNANSSATLTGHHKTLHVLDTDRFVLGYSKVNGGPEGGYVRVGRVSGTTITLGDELSIADRADGEFKITVLDSSRFAIIYREGAWTGHAKTRICTVSDITATSGAESAFNTLNSHVNSHCFDIAALTSGTILGISTYADAMRVGTVNGTDLTWGSETAFVMGNSDSVILEAMDDTTAILALHSSDYTIRVLSVSGDTITQGNVITLPVQAIGRPTLEKLASGVCILTYNYDLSSEEHLRVAQITLSGTTISLEAHTEFATSGGAEEFTGSTARLNDGKFFIGYTESLGGASEGSAIYSIGTFDMAASISGTSALYPSISGDTRISFAMWIQNLTSNSSTVTVERGYALSMTPNTITFGDGPATWSGAGIPSLMSTANDGSDHLLVLDFEYSGGTTWSLYTSIDGANFVDQGIQSSGNQSVLTVDTNPEVGIADGYGVTQWIDELVMWAGPSGDFAQFTNEELSRLHDLADKYDETMDRYAAGPPFDFPLVFTQSAIDLFVDSLGAVFDSHNLFINGHTNIVASGDIFIIGKSSVSNSCNLFIKGPGPSGELLRIIHRLTKTGDYDPQLISNFGTSVSGVNIELWDTVNAQNTPVVISNSGCYNIGNTNTWGWSTENLPFREGNKRYQYYYRMTASGSQEQFGEFLITVPERGRWSYPD